APVADRHVPAGASATRIAAKTDPDRSVGDERTAACGRDAKTAIAAAAPDALRDQTGRALAPRQNAAVHAGGDQIAGERERADVDRAADAAGATPAAQGDSDRSRDRPARQRDGHGIAAVSAAATDALQERTGRIVAAGLDDAQAGPLGDGDGSTG